MSNNPTQKKITSLRVEEAEEWKDELSLPYRPDLGSDISHFSFGNSLRATAPSGVSDLAKCRLRTSPYRLV